MKAFVVFIVFADDAGSDPAVGHVAKTWELANGWLASEAGRCVEYGETVEYDPEAGILDTVADGDAGTISVRYTIHEINVDCG